MPLADPRRAAPHAGVVTPSVTAMLFVLNEAAALGSVLPAIPDWVDELLVVDGGSTDGSLEVIRRLSPRARIVTQPGRGKGDALRYGVAQASGDIIVTLDGDGETDPRDLARFLEPVLAGADFAKGSRLVGGRPPSMRRHRWFGNRVLAVTFNLLYGARFTDICSGFNAFRRDRFPAAALTYDGCEMEQQLLAVLAKRGARIVEVPHVDGGRIAGESKIFSLWQGFYDWIVIIRERFRR